jgi:hypothetical protein
MVTGGEQVVTSGKAHRVITYLIRGAEFFLKSKPLLS